MVVSVLSPMRLLDRYILREIAVPFLIALLVFSFVLIIPFIIELAEQLIAKGVAWPIVLRLMGTLLPATLGLTIPMALLISILVAFGRLSGDREVVVLMACGVSPYRMLRPVLLLGVAATAVTFWVMVEAIPDANQTHREITLGVVADRAEGQVRPREFFEDFPDTVLYVREVPATGGWQDVLAADTRTPAQPIIYVARRGRMLVNRDAQTIEMVLEDGARHATNAAAPSRYEMIRFDQLIVSLDPRSVFPRTGPARGEREMTITELRERVSELQGRNLPFHNPAMEIHKKFSIPVACLVFALLGVALGVSNRKDGKLASFVLGIAVIFVYYVVMFTGQAMTKGGLMPPWLAMWLPNIALGAAGVGLLVLRTRGVDQPLRIRVPSFAWRRPSQGPNAPGADTIAAGSSPRRTGTVVVIRVPQMNLPRPNLLDMYVSRTYLRILVMAVVGIMGLFYISTFIDMSDKLFKGQVTLGTILAFMWWETPQFLYYIIAIAVLLSSIVTIGVLSKNSELIVMRACGISIYRTAAPLLVFAVVASAVLFAFEERVLAFSNRRADYLKHVIRGGSPQTFDVLHRKWLVGRDGEVYHYQYFDPRRQELNAVSVFRFDDETHALTERTYATQAAYAPRAPDDREPWIAKGGWTRAFAGAQVTRYASFDETHLPLDPAAYFVTEAPEPERMTFSQLRQYIDELQASGYNVLEHEVALYRKLAFPLVTLIMTLIAVPFGVTTGKRGAMYGVGVGIALALVYWTANSVFAAFGVGGVISPALAAWAPNLFFGASAAYLLLTVRT
jgi:LPS export ABC transporter permease LptG/LPS export ABC transporter permease LptF